MGRQITTGVRSAGERVNFGVFSVSCLSSINLALSGKMMVDDEKFTVGSDCGRTSLEGESLRRARALLCLTLALLIGEARAQECEARQGEEGRRGVQCRRPLL